MTRHHVMASLMLVAALTGAARPADGAGKPSQTPQDRPDVLIADFEGKDYGDWKVTGTAFGPGPARGAVGRQMAVTGFQGKGMVNSFYGRDDSTGTLTSPPLKIVRKHINFLIGGGGYAGETCINLLVDGKVVRTATGPNTEPGGSETLYWRSWDVTDLADREAVIRIVDDRTGGWGHINVDHIVQSDRVVVVAASARPAKKAAEPGARSQDMTLEELEKLTGDYAARPGVYKEAYRPQFHFTPLTGWMNDPNGLVHYEGEYHLYFQAWPQNVQAGGKIWSHAVSTDLVHWKQIQHALVNEGPRQIFSGSAVIDHNNTAGFQTGKEKTLIAAYTLTNPSVQCIAYSNDRGRTFTKVGKPVVDNINGSNRDPKVFWHEPTGKWVMIFYLAKRGEFILMGSKKPEGLDQAQRFAFHEWQ